MLDQLAAIGHPAGEREQQAAEGVDVLLAFVFGKHRADTLLELLDGGARIGNEAAIRPLDQLRADRDVVLVLDLPDDLLDQVLDRHQARSEEHTSELPSLMRISYAVFCLKKKKNTTQITKNNTY